MMYDLIVDDTRIRGTALQCAIDFLRDDGTVMVDEVVSVAGVFFDFLKGTNKPTTNLSPEVLNRITLQDTRKKAQQAAGVVAFDADANAGMYHAR